MLSLASQAHNQPNAIFAYIVLPVIVFTIMAYLWSLGKDKRK